MYISLTLRAVQVKALYAVAAAIGVLIFEFNRGIHTEVTNIQIQGKLVKQ